MLSILKSEKTLSFGIFTFFILIVLFRYPDLIFSPRMYAEEYLYYETFLNAKTWWEGFDALIYPAYYVLSSRIAAFMAVQFDPIYAPLITTLFGLVILAIPLTIICFTKSKYWESIQSKLILSSFIVFSLTTGEIWLNSTSTGFIFPIAAFLILLDKNIKGIFKISYYSLILILGILSGPITLMMAPFFLVKFFKEKNFISFLFCLIFLIFGMFQIIFFFISYEAGIINTNRGINIELSFFERFYFWVSPNIIFPIFGYFASLVFRMSAIGINSPEEISLLLNQINAVVPSNFYYLIESIFIFLMNWNNVFNIFFLLLIIYFFLKAFAKSDFEERVYFITLFLYLSFATSFLSLAGQGGFRYSLITGFVLLVYIYQKSFNMRKPLLKSAPGLLVCMSITFGIMEYYPRVISYTPHKLFSSNTNWPVWKNELAKWKMDSQYKPKIWPYLKEKDIIWPARTAVYSINMNGQENWEKQGQLRFSKVLTSYKQ